MAIALSPFSPILVSIDGRFYFLLFSMNNSLSPVILGIAIVIGSWIIATNINHTSVITTDKTNNLSVAGDGKVYAKPDTFILSVLSEEKSKTTKDGFARVSERIAQVKDLLTKNGIVDKDIQSTNISINPSYNYDNGKTTIDGFMASHGLSIKIHNLDSVDAILSGVSAIPGVQIQSTSYDIDDKTSLYTEARDLAIAKAKQKATDIAKSSGISLGRILSIGESQGYVSPVANQYFAEAKAMSADMVSGGGVSAGQLEISTTVSISYEIQ